MANQREGQGTLTQPGRVYEGQWARDEMAGHGRLVVHPAQAPGPLPLPPFLLLRGLRCGGGGHIWCAFRLVVTCSSMRDTCVAARLRRREVWGGSPPPFGPSPASGPGVPRKGYTYTGGFLGSRRHGRGTCRYGDGDVYEGQWAQDAPHGAGVLTSKREGGFRPPHGL